MVFYLTRTDSVCLALLLSSLKADLTASRRPHNRSGSERGEELMYKLYFIRGKRGDLYEAGSQTTNPTADIQSRCPTTYKHNLVDLLVDWTLHISYC